MKAQTITQASRAALPVRACRVDQSDTNHETGVLMRRIMLTLGSALGVMLADQLSKYYLIDLVTANTPPVIEVTSFFNLVMVWNYGVSFGMFAGLDARFWLIALSLLICAMLLWWNRSQHHRVQFVATGCIIGGALGNVIDRILYGAVADFFDVHVGGYHWPAFNIADAAIVCGVVALLLADIFLKRVEV